MKKLLLLSALFIFSCSSDDNNGTNPSLEKRISQMGIHDIQICSHYSVFGDSLKITYDNNKISSALGRRYEFDCYSNDWTYENNYDWDEVNFEYTENYIIVDISNYNVMEWPLDNDGNITSIPQRQSDGSMGWDFEYSNGHLTKTTLNIYPNDYDSISTLSWDNDNLTSIECVNQSPYQDNYTIIFQYTDHLNKSELFLGGEYSLENAYDLRFLHCGTSSKNLPSEAFVQFYNQNGLTGSNKFEYQYIFDIEGYVRFLTIIKTDIYYNDWDDTYSEPEENIWTLEFEYTN